MPAGLRVPSARQRCRAQAGGGRLSPGAIADLLAQIEPCEGTQSARLGGSAVRRQEEERGEKTAALRQAVGVLGREYRTADDGRVNRGAQEGAVQERQHAPVRFEQQAQHSSVGLQASGP